MKLFKTALLGSLLLLVTIAEGAEKNCYQMTGSLDPKTVSYLKLKQKPGFVCIRQHWKPETTLVEIYNTQARELGAFEATLKSQARCFNCLDAEYSAYKFYNSDLRTEETVLLTMKTSGDLNVMTHRLNNGSFVIGQSSFLIQVFPAL